MANRKIIRRPRRQPSPAGRGTRRRWVVVSVVVALAVLAVAVRYSERREPSEWIEYDVQVSGLH